MPEIALEKAEAKALAEATAEVAKHYPMAIDPKTIAWVNLATCMGLTYGPRVYMLRKRLDAEARAKRHRAAGAPTEQAAAAAEATEQATGFVMPGVSGAIGPVSEAQGY